MVWLRAIQIQLIWYGLGLYKFQLIWYVLYGLYGLRAIQIPANPYEFQLIWYGLGLCKSSYWFGLGLYKSSLYGMA